MVKNVNVCIDNNAETTQPISKGKTKFRKSLTQAMDGGLSAYIDDEKMDGQVKDVVAAAVLRDPFCANLVEDKLAVILRCMKHIAFQHDQVVMKQGGDGQHFYVLTEGSLNVFIDGKQTNKMFPGTPFGAVALMGNCPRTATVKANGPCQVWSADGDIFRQVIRDMHKERYTECRRFVDRVSFFEGLTPELKDRIADEAMVEEEFASGDSVIREGEQGDALYVLKRGTATIYSGGSRQASGQLKGAQEIGRLKSGDSFGERAALYGERRSSTVTAMTTCTVLCIKTEQLASVLGEDVKCYLQRSFLFSVVEKMPVLKFLSPRQKSKLVEAMKVELVTEGTNIHQSSGIVIALDGAAVHHRNNKVIVSQRGEWVDDTVCYDLEDLRPPRPNSRLLERHSVNSARSTDGAQLLPPAPLPQLVLQTTMETNSPTLIGGPHGCTVAVLTKEALVNTLASCGLAGISASGGEQQIVEYMWKVLGARKVPVFRDLSHEQIQKLVNCFGMKKYLRGASVFFEGELGNAFYVVASGEATVSKDGMVIRNLGRGACFGERAILFDETRSASVEISSETAELWSLDQGDFNTIISKEMRNELMRKIGLQDTNVTLKSLRHVRIVGVGAFGSVRLVEHRRNNTRYALKRVDKKNGEIPPDVEIECDLLSELDHPFAIHFVKKFVTKKSVYILTELVTGGQLFRHCQRAQAAMNKHAARFYVASLVIILEYLHDRGILYRDLKLENVMLDDRGFIKLVDFGLSKKIGLSSGDKTFSLVGTLFYLAPDVIKGKGYGRECDMWSLGVMHYELVTGRLPFGNDLKCEHDILLAILQDPLSIPSFVTDVNTRQFLHDMLTKRKAKRLGCLKGWEEVKAHEYFSIPADGDLFSKIIAREVRPPIIPGPEEYPAEESFEGKVTQSDAEELGGSEEVVVARVLHVFSRVKLGGDGLLGKQQLAKILRILDAALFNDAAAQKLWSAMGNKDETRIEMKYFLKWVTDNDGEAFASALALSDIHA